MDQACLYEIHVEGELPSNWSDWFEGMDVRGGPPGVTILSGRLADQAALHGLLERIRDLNLTLVSVTSSSFPGQDSNMVSSGENTERPAAGSGELVDSPGPSAQE